MATMTMQNPNLTRLIPKGHQIFVEDPDGLGKIS